jgi:hypothetical protein
MIVTIIIIILVTGGFVSNFYLKCSPLASFVTLMASIFGVLVAFTYYEVLAGFIINKGYVVQWAQGLCFILLYALTTVILRLICDYIVGADIIDFGQPAKVITAIVCGVIVGFISSGMIVTALAMTPPGVMSYNRFNETVNLRNSKKPFIPVDSIACGLYEWIADGAMASKNKFGLYHSDFLDQIHLNRHKAKDGAIQIAGSEAITIPKNGVIIKPGKDGLEYTIIQTKISGRAIADGGIVLKTGEAAFTPGQLRLICQQKRLDGAFTGRIMTVYPVKYRIAAENKTFEEVSDLGELVTLDRNSFDKRVARVDLAFEVPSNMTPRYLEFRNNFVIQVPKPLTEEELKNAGKSL